MTATGESVGELGLKAGFGYRFSENPNAEVQIGWRKMRLGDFRDFTLSRTRLDGAPPVSGKVSKLSLVVNGVASVEAGPIRP